MSPGGPLQLAAAMAVTTAGLGAVYARLAGAATVIVPARLGSTRFPEKVLAARTGKPLVQHVVEAAASARCARQIVVATDSLRVAEALQPYGTRVVMTAESHPNGTSRLAEAAEHLGLGDGEIVVNAQGDEPEMPGEVLDSAVGALLMHTGADVGTVAAPIRTPDEVSDPNVVKVVRRVDGVALYFSRAPIPADRDGLGSVQRLRHVGVYAYRVGYLKRYVQMPPTPLEQAERLEQLRVLETGGTVVVGLCGSAHPGIDTPEQYEAFVRRSVARS
jgi:3-deoxy-manno-octulosonate cytidylyltransferase (CMP-KDO synthetase)